jgi:dihydroxy-acid dehydratase
MKSDCVKKGIERAPHRALFNAIGYTEPVMPDRYRRPARERW